MKILTQLVVIGSLLATPVIAAAEEEPAGGHEAEAEKDPSKEFNWASHPAPFGSSSYKAYDAEGGPLGDGAMGPEKHALEPGEEEEPMSVPFIFVLINFGLLLILLGKKAGPIATSMAQSRSDEIKTALDEAARLRNAAKDKLDEYSTKLRSAESDRQRIIAAAEVQAALLKKDAEERIAAEIDRARASLRQEVVLAASGVAEKLLREKTTAADQSNLVDAFLKDVNDATPMRRPS